MHRGEAEDALTIVTGTLSIQAQLIGLVLTCRPPLLSIVLPDGKAVKCDELYEDCHIRIYEHEFLADLYKFELIDFGIILGWTG